MVSFSMRKAPLNKNVNAAVSVVAIIFALHYNTTSLSLVHCLCFLIASADIDYKSRHNNNKIVIKNRRLNWTFIGQRMIDCTV